MRLAALVLTLAACEAHAPGVPDSPPRPDAPLDAPASCGVTVAGEVLDWDSGTPPAPIAGATLTDRDDPTRTTMSGADGAFSLCVPSGNFQLVDGAVPPGSDALPMVLFANQAAIVAGAKPSLRTMTAARRDAFFAGEGGAYDGAAGQLLVHFSGPAAAAHEAAITNTPGLAAQAWNPDGAGGFAWTATDTGLYVFFGNVALGTTANTVVSSDAAGVVGASFPIPLVPGAISVLELYVP